MQPAARPARLEGLLRPPRGRRGRRPRADGGARQPWTASRACTAAQTRASTSSSVPVGVDHRAALRLGARDGQEALAQPLVEGQALGFEPHLRARPRTWPAPARSSTGRSKISVRSGRVVLQDVGLQRGDQRRVRAAGRALIGAGRIRRSGRRPPRRPRASAGRITRSTWSRRAAYISSVSVTGLQRSAAPFSTSSRMLSAPGEPPGSRVATTSRPLGLQARDQALELGGFARPLAAFECDEPPSRHRPKMAGSPRMSSRWPL